MSELNSGGDSTYPSIKDTNNVDEVDSPSREKTIASAKRIKTMSSAIVNIENAVGESPQGNKTDLVARLAVSMDGNGYIGSVRHSGRFSSIQAAINDLPI